MYPNQNCQPCNSGCPEVEIPAPPPCEGEPCVEITTGECVRYTGPNITCLGVTTNMTLNQVVQAIATSLCDNTPPPPTPVDCVVSEWGAWGACTNGTRTRTRTIVTQPANGGAACPPLTETQSCTDCVVSAWSEWGACVNGVQTRTRTVITPASNGGAPCPPLTETQACNSPVDCVVSSWSPWSECVDGQRTRTRTIITPASNGGAACPPLSETEDCTPPTCPAPTNLEATVTSQ